MDAAERAAFCTIQLYSPSLHHRRYVDCTVGATCTASGSVACAAQPVSLAHAHNSTRLRDSVRQATSQVQRRSRDSVEARNAPVLREEIAVLLAKDAIEPVPPAEMRQGFYSPYFIVPKKGGGLRPILDLRLLNRALHRLPFKMLTHRRMIKCIQPRDWFAAIDLKDAYFHVSILPDTDRSYGLRSKVGHGSTGSSPSGSPLSPCLHEGRRGRPCPVTGSGRQDPQLSRRLAHSGPVPRTVVRSQGSGASAPQPVGASGQLGKEQALPCAENLFSWCGVRLGEYDGASRKSAPNQC